MTGLVLTPGNGEIDIAWNRPAGATGYKVRWKSGSRSFSANRQHMVSSDATVSGAVTGLSNGTAYTGRPRVLLRVRPRWRPSVGGGGENAIDSGIVAGVAPDSPAWRRVPRPPQVKIPLLIRTSRIRAGSAAERIDDRTRSSEKTPAMAARISRCSFADSSGTSSPKTRSTGA